MRTTSFRHAIQIAAAAVLWIGANVVALVVIDAYEFQASCREADVPVDVASRFQTVSLPEACGNDSETSQPQYKLRQPIRLEPAKKYPVLLYLHGAGERGSDGFRPLRTAPAWLSSPEYQRRYPCFLVVPQCPSGKHWNLRGNSTRSQHDELDVVLAMIRDVLSRYPIADPCRVYLVGFSMGGYGAWELAARHPEMFAAVVPIAGKGNPEFAQRLADLPIWAVHGQDDDVVDIEGSRAMVAAIREAGGNPRLSELAGVGHGSLEPALLDNSNILDWLFDQSKESRQNDQG